MPGINTQIFLAYLEYKAWKPENLMPFEDFRVGALRDLALIHLWLSRRVA